MAEEKETPPGRRQRWMLSVLLLALLTLIGSIIIVTAAQAGRTGTAQTSITATRRASNKNPYVVRTPPPPPTCVATVKVDKVLSHGFQATVKVKNTSSQTLNTWMIYWSLPANVHLVKGWNAQVFRDGDVIMAHPFSTNRTFPAGYTMSVGFEATGPSEQPA